MALYSAQGPQLGLPHRSRPKFGYVGALMVWLFAHVQHDGHDGLNLAGEALHTTVHGGVKLWVVVVTAVRARARAGSAWQACRGSAPFVATQQRRRTTHG
ncbi:hypothetical protein ACFYNZ_26135 [Streptomyces kebangsaanensis]|uniref:Uncharacterized protein n=1 Tax=Streptomyces kebangsaanensis TaxID=864058 RepID=A0ABW6L133_9ACTN